MKASDPRLLLIARRAAVRPPHVYHCFHSIAENPRAFNADAFAEFSGLERRHVDRIMSALAESQLLPKYKARESAEGRGTRLAADFALPDDWMEFAQAERRWHQYEVIAEFRTFLDYWTAQPGQRGVKLDWPATWRNWVRRSKTPNGTWRPERKEPLRVVTLVEQPSEREVCTPDQARKILEEEGLPSVDPIKFAASALSYRDL